MVDQQTPGSSFPELLMMFAHVPLLTRKPPGNHAQAALDAIRSQGGKVTNMKRTLARQPVALRAALDLV